MKIGRDQFFRPDVGLIYIAKCWRLPARPCYHPLGFFARLGDQSFLGGEFTMSRSGSNRREFLKSSAIAGVGLLGAGYFVNSAPAAESTSPNSKLRFACIGVGGKGKEEARDAAKFGDVVAI